MNDDRLRVGVITSPHGIHGEVNVFPTTDDVNRFSELKNCYIDMHKEIRPVEIDSVKYFKGMAILHFKGIDDRNEVEKLRQCDILIDREYAVPLEEGEYFICDIIGFKVVTDTGSTLGTLEDVIQTAANFVYSVRTEGGKEVLIPSIPDCILERNFEERFIRVHLLPGLLEL